MNVNIPGLKYNKTINEQLDVFESHLNQCGTLLLELQSLNEKQKVFLNWLDDKINQEVRTQTKIEDNSIKISESDEMNVYLDVLKKYIKIFDLEVERENR